MLAIRLVDGTCAGLEWIGAQNQVEYPFAAYLAWVLSALGGLAADDEHNARLRHTLLVFLQTGGQRSATCAAWSTSVADAGRWHPEGLWAGELHRTVP